MALSQEEVHLLQLGRLLFSDDFEAICHVLMPGHQISDLVEFQCRSSAYSTQSCYVSELHRSGLQPGSLVSGNARLKLLKRLSSAAGRNLQTEKPIQAAFKAYDNCSLPLRALVEVLVEATSAAAFASALWDAVPCGWLDTERLTCTAANMTWQDLQEKAQQQPTLFDRCIWPVLSEHGWRMQATAGTAVMFMAPATGPASHLVSTDHPASCSSQQEVLELCATSHQPVLPEIVQLLREAEAGKQEATLLAASGRADAPHMVAADPTGRTAGLPTSKRRLMCANCGTSSTRVWRVANAGLMCCNACGMFYQKHHAHRPEHLLAANRAKQDARLAAGAATPSTPHLMPAQPCDSCGPAGSDACTADERHEPSADFSLATSRTAAGHRPLSTTSAGPHQELDRATKRQRTRRQPQVSRRLVSQGFVLYGGPLAHLHPDSDTGGATASDGEGCDSEVDWQVARTISRAARHLAHGDEPDDELEHLLQLILGNNRSDPSPASDEAAAATLVAMAHSSASSAACDSPCPAHSSLQAIKQHQHQQQCSNELLAGAAAAARAAFAAAPESGRLPQPALAAHSMAEAWVHLQPHTHSNQSAGPAIDHGTNALARHCRLPEGYGGSFGVEPSALQAIMSQEGRGCRQQLAAASPAAIECSTGSVDYHCSGLSGGVSVCQGWPGCDEMGLFGVPVQQGAAAPGGVCRQDSAVSSYSSLAMQQSLSGGSGSGSCGGLSVVVNATQHRSMSRFASERQQVARSLASSPSRSPGRPRHSSKRRGGQPSCCDNCGCEFTCLWRRDKYKPSRILCNACGIYKATNGIDRPQSGRLGARKGNRQVVSAQAAKASANNFNRQVTSSCPVQAHPPLYSWPPLTAAVTAQAHHDSTEYPGSPTSITPGSSPGSFSPLFCGGLSGAFVAGRVQGTATEDSSGTTQQLASASASMGAAAGAFTVTTEHKPAAVLDLSTSGLGQGGTQAAWLSQEATGNTISSVATAVRPQASAAVVGTRQQESRELYYLQQQQQQQQQPGQGSLAACGPQETPQGDAALHCQLSGVWRHAQALQQPIVCTSTGYRVFPDGRCTKVADAELKAVLGPFLQRHSSSNSSQSSQEMAPALLQVPATGTLASTQDPRSSFTTASAVAAYSPCVL